MAAARKSQPPVEIVRPVLKIVVEELDTGTTSPGVGREIPTDQTSEHAAPTGGLSERLRQWNAAAQQANQPKVVPAESRSEYAASTSLREFWLDCTERQRWEPLGRRGRSKATRDKERQALNRWERYTRPSDWPEDEAWPGWSLETLGGCSMSFLDAIFDRMVAEKLAPATVKSTRNHLRTLFNHAAKVKAIDRAPTSAPRKERDEPAPIYTPEEVAKVVSAFAPEPLLQAAFAFALNVGPRSVDLFLLKWSDFSTDALGRKVVAFESRKTGKLQGIPIAATTWKILERLKALPSFSEGGCVFPSLTNSTSLDPEKSYEARIRNKVAKGLMLRAGVNRNKPWQAARATCNERYESQFPGVGSFILGHSTAGVNARSYRNPTASVFEAVNGLTQYECLKSLSESAVLC